MKNKYELTKKQKQMIIDKNIKNNFIYLSFGFGLLGSLLILWPAGIEIQMQWWYLTAIVTSGIIGYVAAYKARKINKQYFARYRIYLNPRLTTAGLVLSAFSLLAGTLMSTFVLALYL